MDNIKFGISISSYSSENTPKQRFLIIKRCLDSINDLVYKKYKNIYINVCLDTGLENHHELLKQYPFHVIKNKKNMGISYTKNVGIKSILGQGCKYGFLLDDDVVIKNGIIFSKYIEAMEKTGYGHFSYLLHKNNHMKKCNKNIVNGHEILRTPHVNGLLLSFSKEGIKKSGYFDILPYKYGHEHSKFSIKNIHFKVSPYFCDISEEGDYLEEQWSFQHSSVRGTKEFSELKFKQNESMIHRNNDKKVFFEIDKEITDL